MMINAFNWKYITNERKFEKSISLIKHEKLIRRRVLLINQFSDSDSTKFFSMRIKKKTR